MRTFHRALRRAGLPVRLTGGYNPRPRVVFPHALEVGIASEDEVVEIELDEWVPPAEFARRLSGALPEGLTLGEVKLMPPKRKGASAVEAAYEAELGDEELGAVREGVRRFLESDTWKIERTRPDGTTREIDLRPQVIDVRLEGIQLEGVRLEDVQLEEVRLRDPADPGPRLVMRLRLGQPGAARPREVLAAVLGCRAEEALGMRLKKTKTVLSAPA